MARGAVLFLPMVLRAASWLGQRRWRRLVNLFPNSCPVDSINSLAASFLSCGRGHHGVTLSKERIGPRVFFFGSVIFFVVSVRFFFFVSIRFLFWGFVLYPF